MDDPRARRCMAFAFLGGAILATGCVERRYTIRTNPPGAMVSVAGEPIGTTPVSRSYTYYGDRDIQIVADGYQTARFIQPIKAPWWDNVFTEFFTENLLPFQFRDEREFTYNLTPQVNPPQGDVLNRANALRAEAQSQPPPRPSGIRGWFGALE